MPSWSDFIQTITEPFARMMSLESGIHWIPLSGAVVIALLVYAFRGSREGSTGVRGFIAFCFPARVYSTASAALDFKYLVVNTLVYGIFIAPMVLTSAGAAQVTVNVLVAAFGIPETPVSPGLVTDIAMTVGIVVAADLGFFVSHYLQHRVSFLWEFHKVHHSAEVLHPVTAYRSHPVDEAIKMTIVVGGIGVFLGLSAYLIGQPVEGFTVLGINVLILLFSIAGSHLRHSHVWLSYGPLDGVFVSPAMHQIHHSSETRHADKNLGGMFTIWDRLAGTLYLPHGKEEFPLGLHLDEHREYTSVLRLYILPFTKVARRVGAAAQRRVGLTRQHVSADQWHDRMGNRRTLNFRKHKRRHHHP
jgi:sterol desaturase/sphingolipid hydroxylase (fatty acid hydroxylase superfamily)